MNDMKSAGGEPPNAAVVITLPDGSQRSFDGPVSGAEIAADIGPGLARAAIAVAIDGEVKDLAASVAADAQVAIVTRKSPEALELPSPQSEVNRWSFVSYVDPFSARDR